MKVYIVEEVTDFEYGCRSVVAVFGDEEDANEYVLENGGTWSYWRDGSERDTMRVVEWEVQ